MPRERAMVLPPMHPMGAERTASLVYHTGALGDFITTLPAFTAWRRLHPGARIVLLGKPAFAALCGGNGLFDDSWDAEAARAAFLFASEIDPSRAGDLADFDSALLFSHSSSPLAVNLAACGVRTIVRQDPLPTGGDIHVVDYHLSLFAQLALSEEERIPRLSPRMRAASGESPVAIHPGSGSPRKNWPPERFAQLSRLIESDGKRVVWIVGPTEDDSLLPPNAVAWRRLELPLLASLLSGCSLFVGNDSGIAHLAAAVGCSVVVLFGSSNPRVWSPRAKRVVVVDSGGRGMNALSVQSIFSACRDVVGGG